MTVALPPALVADFEALASGQLEQPPEWLGVRYEASRQGSLERRQGGAHYTPTGLISPIVRATLEPLLRGRDAAALLRLRVVDPSMGAGAFLAETCRVLADRLLELGGAATELEARRLVAMSCIHGVDLDPIAVMLARRVLWLVVGDDSVALDGFDGQLRQGNGLVGEGRRAEARQKFPSDPFHWHREFPEVFPRGFDVLLGNPPFRNAVENRVAAEPAQKFWWKTRWPRFARGASDRSLLFWARSLEDLLAPEGRYGMLSPTALLSDSGPWQAWMFEHWRPDHLWLEPVDRFEGARVRTTAIIGGEGSASRLEVRDREFGARGAPVHRSWPEESCRWYWMTRPDPIRIKSSLCEPLSECFTVRAGCSTGAAYSLRDHVQDQALSEAPRLVTTGAIDRYRFHWGRKQRFLGRDLYHPRWPEGDAPSDVQRARDAQAGVKILVGGLTRVIEAWMDTHGESAGIVSTWVIQAKEDELERLGALLVVLNSATLSRLYRQEHGGASMSGRQVTIKKRALLELPLPCALRDPSVRRELTVHARRLSEDSGAGAPPPKDLLAHTRVAELYGRSKRQGRADWEWWLEAGGFGSS